MKIQMVFISVLVSVLASVSRAQPISDSLNDKPTGNGPMLHILDYLTQVREKHDGYHGSREQAQAAILHGRDSHLMLAPTLFANVQTTQDKKPGTLFIYDSEVVSQYSLGVSQTTDFGLSGRLYYSIAETKYNNLSIGGPAQDVHTLTSSPILELTLSLWRNWLGAEVDSTVAQGDAQNLQAKSNDTYQMRTILVQAALAYWNLNLARETVRVSKDAVDRNAELLKWHQRRFRDGLGDRADVLQQDAALQASVVNLKNAQDAVTTASRTFNLSRGDDAPNVSEQLLPMTSELIDRLTPPKRKALRDDVEAALHGVEVSKAAAELAKQRFKPTFELFGSYAFNNDNPYDIQTGYTAALTQYDRPTTMVGLRLNAPLDLKLIHDSKQGWEKEKMAADTNYRRKLLEQDFDWDNLNDKFRQGQERFHLYTELEKKQKEKFDYERTRRAAGRTTTEQVLLFENDYESAQYSRIQSLSDVFTVYSQMKLYEDTPTEVVK